MHKHCFICGHELIWVSDEAENCGYERPGILHEYSCPNCGSEYTVFEPLEKPN